MKSSCIQGVAFKVTQVWYVRKKKPESNKNNWVFLWISLKLFPLHSFDIPKNKES